MNRMIERIREMLGRTGGHKWKAIRPSKYFDELKKIYGGSDEDIMAEMDIPKYECENCGITRYLTRKVFPKSECALMQVRRVHLE